MSTNAPKTHARCAWKRVKCRVHAEIPWAHTSVIAKMASSQQSIQRIQMRQSAYVRKVALTWENRWRLDKAALAQSRHQQSKHNYKEINVKVTLKVCWKTVLTSCIRRATGGDYAMLQCPKLHMHLLQLLRGSVFLAGRNSAELPMSAQRLPCTVWRAATERRSVRPWVTIVLLVHPGQSLTRSKNEMCSKQA